MPPTPPRQATSQKRPRQENLPPLPVPPPTQPLEKTPPKPSPLPPTKSQAAQKNKNKKSTKNNKKKTRPGWKGYIMELVPVDDAHNNENDPVILNTKRNRKAKKDTLFAYDE